MINEKLKKKWVDALRSGKYEQGRGELRSTDDTYCCLGVLCDVIDPANWQRVYNEKRSVYHYYYGSALVSLPTSLSDEISLSFTDRNTLMSMNDSGVKTFSEIADWIETNL